MPLGLDSLKGGDNPEEVVASPEAPVETKPVETKKETKKVAAKKKSASGVFIATESGSAEGKHGDVYPFLRGITRVAAGHELLKLVPDYFKPVEDHVHYGVVSATQGPGEER